MNATTPTELGQVAAAHIQNRRHYRAARLLQLRTMLAEIARTGRLSASELQDFICCLHCNAGSDLVKAKKSLLELSCDLDGIVHYGSDE